MLSAAARVLWGKSDRDKRDGVWHPLICHMVDVAACAARILEREPQRSRDLYAQDLGFSEYEVARGWLLLFIALHDVGKASPSFQSMWPPGATRTREAGLTWKHTPTYQPHGFIGQVVIPELEWQGCVSWKVCCAIADAVACHHGLRATASDLKIDDRDGGFGVPSWDAARASLFDACVELFAVDLSQALPLESFSPAAFERLAGLCSFADWLGSNPDFFPFGPEMDDLGAYWQRSLDRAEKALDHIGWFQRSPLTENPVFETVFPFPPRPLQQATIELLDGVDAPVLLLVEAPMGEGKTEVAFFGHLQLQCDLGHRGLYTALPTKATGNAMYTRKLEFVGKFRPGQPIDLQLLHGAALLNTKYQNLKIRNVDEYNAKIKKPHVVALEWFSNKKRGLLSEYGVGTIDQALLSVLPVKHQFVRLWGLSNRTVVIDEVHAYDTYTSGLIETLLRWLHALGSSAIVMSATLPKARRDALLRAYGARAVPDNDAYPRVWRVINGHVTSRSFPADPERALAVQLRAARAELDQVAPLVLQAVQAGGCAVCILNTVQRAQDLHEALKADAAAQGVQLLLFHARFPANERQKLEERVLAWLGKKGERPQKAIVIGTQVLEQSLDYDADVMFTDLAPVDLVLQRAGRLWRHQRDNRHPTQTTPVLYVLGLEQAGEVPELNKDVYWDVVYDRAVLLRSFAVLQARSRLHLPNDIDPLVQRVYDEQLLEVTPALATAIEQALIVTHQERDAHEAFARDAVIGQPDGFFKPDKLEQYDPEDDPQKHKDLQATTRLGEPTVTVIPMHAQADGSFKVGKHVVRLEEVPEFYVGLQMYLHNVSLGRWELMTALWQRGAPESWKDHSLLRNCYPLELVDGKAVFGNLEVSLDDVLGVVYRKLSN